MPLTISPTKAEFNERGDGSFALPFTEQISFFKGKLGKTSKHWDDIIKSQHDRAFIVAGAAKADLVNDLQKAVQRAIDDGESLQDFRTRFKSIVSDHGWTGWTGEGSKKGRDWRTRIIYQTNLQNSYAAGRYKQLTDPDLLAIKPYWQYIHSETVKRPRPLHKAWNGTTLPHDDPWWQSHFPPGGFGCRCRISAVSASDYDGQAAPDDGDYNYTDRHGDTHVLPNGIDYGFDYIPGKPVNPGPELKQLVDTKAQDYPPKLADAFKQQLKPVTNAIPKYKAAKTAAEAKKLAQSIIESRSDIDYVKHDDGQYVVAYRHKKQKGYVGIDQSARQHTFKTASLGSANLDACNAINKALIDAQHACDKIGIPRLRGVNRESRGYVAGSMGDGVISLNPKLMSAYSDGTLLRDDPARFTRTKTNLEGDIAFVSHSLFKGADKITAIVWHELGHHVHQQLAVETVEQYKRSRPLETKLSKLFKSKQDKFFATKYAAENSKEWFAECFALYMMDRKDLVDDDILMIINSIYAGEVDL